MVRLVIAHRCTLVRDVLRMLGPARDIFVVGEAEDPSQLLDVCRAELPDVVITEGDYDDAVIEPSLPDLVATGASIAVICDDRSASRMTGILSSGASGWLGHDAAPAQVLDAVEALGAGSAVLDPAAARTIVEDWRRLRIVAGENGT